MIIDSLLHNDIDLDRTQARVLRSLDSCKTLSQFASPATHRTKHLLINAVETNRDAVQSAPLAFRRRCQQHAVGCQREILNAGQSRQPLESARQYSYPARARHRSDESC